jgi:hypothetical protein
MIALLALAAAGSAQPVVEHQARVEVAADQVEVRAASVISGPTPFVTHFAGGPSAAVKGAPYSAESTTESIQILADGNRIVNKSSNKTYRDSEGRTRTEITPGPIGAWVPDTKQFSVTMIDDPVTGEHITLNNNAKQATRFATKNLLNSAVEDMPTGAKVRTFTTTVSTSASAGTATPLPPLPPPPAEVHANVFFVRGQSEKAGVIHADVNTDVKTEDLGKQVIEGVECAGTRITSTLPAGAVGNERALTTVTESWFSPELKVTVLTKTADPRFGETTNRLTNILRVEQPRSLFEIPSDYKVDEPAVNIKTVSADVVNVKPIHTDVKQQ